MDIELTEDEMRRALFGHAQTSEPLHVPHVRKELAVSVTVLPPIAGKKRKPPTAFTPKLKVTLRVGNEFEGSRETFFYDADTLSILLAEQEATKAARKKYRYVDVVSVKPAK